nr:auxin-responsive protein SAUR50-like [Ipomoea batatas]
MAKSSSRANGQKKNATRLKIMVEKLQKMSFLMGSKRSNRFEESDDVVPNDVKEGHFAVMAVDDDENLKRFIVPLSCLTHPSFLKLLEQAAEEYGFHHEGAVMVPCRPYPYLAGNLVYEPEIMANKNHPTIPFIQGICKQVLHGHYLSFPTETKLPNCCPHLLFFISGILFDHVVKGRHFHIKFLSQVLMELCNLKMRLSGVYPKVTSTNCKTGGGSFPTSENRKTRTESLETFSHHTCPAKASASFSNFNLSSSQHMTASSEDMSDASISRLRW